MTKVLSASNAQILNTVRANSSLEYQSRIPAVTDGNISKALIELDRYTPMWNEFVHGVLNVVGLRLFNANHYENRLKPLKSGSLAWGGMVEEYGMNLIEGEEYDANDTNVFAADSPDIEVNWHRINKRLKYKLKVNEDLLSEAVETEGALAEFITYVMEQPRNSAEWDEYKIMLELLAKSAESDGMANIQVEDILSASDPEVAGKNLVKKISTWYEKSKFYRNDTNAAGIDAISNNMILLTTPEINASQNVDVLAAAFNMDRAQFMADRTIVVDEWPDLLAGTQAVLIDKDWYKCFITKDKVTSIYNPSTLDWVHYLHRWGIYSASRMRPIIRFSTDETNLGTVSAKTVSSVAVSAPSNFELVPGADIPITGTVTYSDSSTDHRVFYLITGTSNTAPGANASSIDVIKPDSGTYVDRMGVLHVSDKNTYKSITVTAVSTMNPGKNASVTLDAE